MKKQLSVTLDEAIVKRVAALAEREGRTLSSMINEILKLYLVLEEFKKLPN